MQHPGLGGGGQAPHGYRCLLGFCGVCQGLALGSSGQQASQVPAAWGSGSAGDSPAQTTPDTQAFTVCHTPEGRNQTPTSGHSREILFLVQNVPRVSLNYSLMKASAVLGQHS